MKKKVIDKAGSVLVTVYIFLIFCILPFYLENHHYNVGEAKSRFFWGTSIIVLILLGVWCLIRKLWNEGEQNKKGKVICAWNNTSWTEKFLLLYTLFIIISYAFSEYKQETLWGVFNWRFGLIPLLLVSGMTVVTIHLWSGNKWIAAAIGSVSAIVFLLGVCNRFSVYPILIEPMQPEFISTLGNIKWFCGYLAVIAPVGIGMFVIGKYTDPTEQWKKLYWGMYAVLSFVTGFCQGSDSVYLWYGSLFAILLWIVAEKKEWLQNWLVLFIMWALSAQLVRLIKFLAPGCFNYEAHKYLINSNFTLIIALIAAGTYFLLFSRKGIQWKFTNRITRNLRILVIASISIGVLAWLGLSIYNTTVGIPGLEQSTLFLLNEKWGTDRGAEMKTAIELWLGMPLVQKLFGCGPDGFYYYAYSIPEMFAYLRNLFDDAYLINAHCELLTSMVNIGVLGTMSFIGVFVTFVYRCMKKGKEQPLLYIPAVCVVCYFAHNLVSFAQIINYPYVFLIMGMGEWYLRKIERDDLKDQNECKDCVE